MLDRPVIAFDIETIPDPDIGRRVMAIEGDDAAVVAEMVRRRLAETRDAQRYPPLPWHRVICACVTVLDPRAGTVEMRALGRAPDDERSIVEAFFDLFEGASRPPRIVSWNGAGFDLPVLRYRALRHGVAAPGFHREEGRYGHRHDTMHVDVMDALSGYGASARAGLGTVAELLGLPGKSFLDREVYEHWLAGEHERVVEYCKLDTLETMLSFLAWSVHVGALSRSGLAAHVARVRDLVAAQTYPAWAAVADALRSWPAWP